MRVKQMSDLFCVFFENLVVDKHGDGNDACCEHQKGQWSPNVGEEYANE